MPADPIGPLDVEAYLDGELDLARKLAVEDYLAGHPALAARVFADLRNSTALRLLQPASPASRKLLDAARRANDTLSPRRRPLRHLFSPVNTAAAAALTLACGTLAMFVAAQDAQATSPPYVGDAVMAFRTGLLRANMPSQVESTTFDAGDVQRSARISVPALPPGWRITDVQLFPSDDGPALQIMVRTDLGRTVSIFAVRSRADAPARPATISQGAQSVAFWRSGDIAYALIGVAAPGEVDLAAEDLADNRVH